MSRRVIIGHLNSGDYGLRVGLPSVDAFTATDNGSNISFDSTWTDLTQATLVGQATKSGSGSTSLTIIIPNLGFIPFIEMRVISGAAISDDGKFGTTQFGLACTCERDRLVPGILGNGQSVIYVVYKVPVMSG